METNEPRSRCVPLFVRRGWPCTAPPLCARPSERRRAASLVAGQEL